MKNKIWFLITLMLFSCNSVIYGCTIFSAKDKKGHVWAGNNEDMFFIFNTYLNIVSPTESSFGYIYFSYSAPEAYPQGGVNEAGLFFDGNALIPGKTVYKGYDKKKDYPGGFPALMHFIMKKCKNVNEVLALFREYRIQGLEAGQFHFADKYGNLGIVVADSMWITKSNFQVSTNYNLAHPDKDGVNCWRFPIAERILKSQEAGFETFRQICDSTSMKSRASTIYSNIHDLNSGDIWLFYGMNYRDCNRTTIKDLLKKGNTSILMRDLFMNEPLVKISKTYQLYGIKQCLRELDSYQLPELRKIQILRLLSHDLIMFNHDLNAYEFLKSYINLKRSPDEILQLVNAVSLFCLDKKDDALRMLKEFQSEFPHSMSGNICLNRMNGKFDENANVKLELKGYENAKGVFVEGFSFPNITDFLIRKNGKWIGEFKLPPGLHSYYFSVDGERVLDPNNPDIVENQGADCNRIVVK